MKRWESGKRSDPAVDDPPCSGGGVAVRGARAHAQLPASGLPRVLSVSELTTLIRTALEVEFGALWVSGEISNLRRPPSGHLYFILKDQGSQLSAVMFRQAVRLLPFDLTDGVEVVIRGRLGLYAPRGDLQIYVDAVEPKGIGALQLAFEQLKARLDAEGLFALERKRPLPFLPGCVGVVTALGGAAIHDILVTLKHRNPSVDVRIAPARVQGVGAAKEIAGALADLVRSGGVDVIIVGRGGGSIEDLWAFNEEVVARAIAASTVPVVSAVGHEVDFTIADFVADMRAPTPTAAAQLVVPDAAELKARVATCLEALRSMLRTGVEERRATVRGVRGRLGDPRQKLQEGRLTVDLLWWKAARAMEDKTREARANLRQSALHLEQLAPARRLEQLRERVRGARTRLALGIGAAIERQRARVGRSAARLDGLSPLAVLDRGYALVWREDDGQLIRDAERVSCGDRVRMRFARGMLWARVEDEEH